METIEKLRPALPKGSLPLLKRVVAVCGCICFIVIGCAGNDAIEKACNRAASPTAGGKVQNVPRNHERKASNPFIAFWHKAWKILTGTGDKNETKLILPPQPEEKPKLASLEEKPRSDFPLVQNKEVERFINLYKKYRKVDFQRRLARAQRYLPLMKKIFREHGVPEELVYVALVESGFHPVARSNANAVGIWQFTRATGKHYGLRYSYWFDERRDPVKSTVAAAMYLSDLYEMFNDWYLALAAYNAGTGAVERAIKRYKTRDFWKLSERKALPRQTRNYVPKILAAITIANDPLKYGFSRLPPAQPLEFEDIIVSGRISIRTFARWIGIRLNELKGLNPELLSNEIYAGDLGYRLHLPKNSIKRYLGQHGCILPDGNWNFVHYQAKAGENLYSIATQYGTDPLVICQANDLPSLLKTKKTQHLLIPVPRGTNAHASRVLAFARPYAASYENASSNKDHATSFEHRGNKILPNYRFNRVLNDFGTKSFPGKTIGQNDLILKPGFLSRLFPGSRFLHSLHPGKNS